jgi:CubicO group peptidase (beta-lactamase class C family)
MRVFATMVLAVLGLVRVGQAVADDAGLKARLDAVIDRAIEQKRIVGTVVLVARDGRVVYRRAAGFADREARRTMREEEVFRLASMSKTIVSAAALALVERGRLGLDDPVTRWIPEFRPRLPDGREPAINVRQLLTHTAGLSYGFLEPADGPYHRANVSDGLDQPGLSIGENLRRIASVPLSFEPGTSWAYSVATDVLGEVVARAGDAPLPEMVGRLVTGPLRMRDTGFAPPDPSRLATPYADATPEPVRMADLQVVKFGDGAGAGLRFSPSRVFDRDSFPSAGAGMVGTADDYLTFLEALRKGGAPILKPETVRQMTANQIGVLVMPDRPGWGFGYGFAVLKDRRAAETPHSAGTYQWGGAYGHHWFVDPERRLTLVGLTNTAVAGTAGPFPDGLRDAAYADDR